jgi:3-hydroxyisobutyrate dehydrogenase-like beta-hydroxyacid dehydrogenase
MSNNDVSVAFIGLGVMGFPIAERILSNGFRLVGFDLSETAQIAAREVGMPLAGSVAACVEGAELICTMLPSVKIADEVAEQVLENAAIGSTLVDLGTIGPSAAIMHAKKAAAKGVDYLDAPVINGGRKGAIAGSLKIVAGGDAEVVARVNPCLRSFSTETFHVGVAGAAQSMKLVHNMLLSVITCGTAEALVLAQELGISAAVAAEILMVSSARSFALEWLFPPALAGDYSGGANVSLIQKDLHLVTEEAQGTKARTDFGTHARKLFDECGRHGYGQDDMSVVYRLLQNAIK